MAENTWYALHDDEQVGPIELDSLQEMAAAGTLKPDDLVWQAGTPGWIPAAQVGPLGAAAGWGDPRPPALPPTPGASLRQQFQPQLESLRHRVGDLDQTHGAIQALPHLRIVHRLLDSVRRQISVVQLDLTDQWAKRIGSLAYMAAAALFCGYFVVASLKADSIQQLLISVVLVLPVASLCHYIAVLFLESSHDLLGRTPTELSSEKLAITLGQICGVLGLVVLASASHDLFQRVRVPDALLEATGALVLLYAGAVFLNPRSLNVATTDRDSGAREAIDVSFMLAKLPLRLIPVSFGLASLLAAALAGYVCYQAANGVNVYSSAVELAPMALAVGLLPISLYLLAVVLMLLVEVFRSWLDTSDGVQGLLLRSGPRSEKTDLLEET